ncbi:MAG: winged helix-turn-helix transcriptional regulator [Hyphomonadaceae bacterium]|nr:winged helix-turn-helix transcriptional regulator [Hyphomonadaceae bacterium]
MSHAPAGGHAILTMLQAFIWFDEGLQSYIRSRGWPEITRPQSMLMANIALGVNRPADIARQLGVTRQMIHVTLNQMAKMGVLALVDSPEDRRAKIVVLTPAGEKMRADAQTAMRLMVEELSRRIGAKAVERIVDIDIGTWGQSMRFDPPARRPARRTRD